MRIGGNSVDETTWAPAGEGSTDKYIAPSDINALAAFVQSIGWRVIYGINLASNNAQAAADEAAHAAAALGSALLSFEIGNEPDFYADHGYRPHTYAVSDFMTEWSLYTSAISASVPGAVFNGPSCSANVTTWTIPFARSESTHLALLTQHYYRANAQDATSTMQLLLSPDARLLNQLQELKSITNSTNISMGYRISECNSYYNGGVPGVSDAHGASLWAIDFMMTIAEGGASGINFHGGGTQAVYTPISDSNSSVVAVKPEYYAMLLLNQIAPGAMFPTQVTTLLLLTAYTVDGNDGATYIVVVNKDPAVASSTLINLGASATEAIPLLLTGPSLTATTGTTLGGAIVADDGSWSPNDGAPIQISGSRFTVTVPAGSAVLFKVT